MGSRILRLREVESRVGISRASIYSGVKAGTFPAQVKISPNAVGWIESEIEAWLQVRIAERDSRER